jgi:chromosome segregation ATPase
LAHQKDLEEENAKLQDRLAVGVMEGTEEEKAKASDTIAELREQVRQLEVENMTLKTSRDQYMRENAEMKKQLVYFKRKIQKYEKEVA